jgi:NADH-quinone oxidoreductase subunit E
MSFTWTDESLTALKTLEKRYPDAEALVLPALWKVQDQEGFIPLEGIEAVAKLTGRSRAEVYGVATFYTMFHLQPIGTHHIQVCKTLSCALNGQGSILDHLKDRLGIEVGETTPDGQFTLTQVECLGACGTSPVMQINDTLHEHLTVEAVENILSELKS